MKTGLIRGDIFPKQSMYGIFTYIYHILPLKPTIHVGKYTSPMDEFWVLKKVKQMDHINRLMEKAAKARAVACFKNEFTPWKFNMGVSKNRGTPKWMVYDGNPY